jgi:HAD superfamily hydrolase (TIGR01490 family)
MPLRVASPAYCMSRVRGYVHGEMRIAFFDLDKTIISRNSATLWIRAELSERRITWRQALRATAWLIRYSLGASDMTSQIRLTIASLAGKREADMRERTRMFHARHIRPLYRPGALTAIETHRRAGEHLVLLTSSSNYLAEEVCRDLRLDDYVCNRFEVDESGRYTGRPIEPLCFGSGKVLLAERYAARHGIALARVTFYTDSHSDLPMLEAAGDPAVVHPDPRLRRLARQRGWRTLDWGTP